MRRDLAIKPNSTSWAKSVRHLLQSIGFNNAGRIKVLETYIKRKIKWQIYITLEFVESSRARTYVLFCNFRLQPYLTWTLEKRISLSRLRMSSHILKVWTGRWQKPTAIPFNERKCTLCFRLEDECPLYKDLERNMLKNTIGITQIC